MRLSNEKNRAMTKNNEYDAKIAEGESPLHA